VANLKVKNADGTDVYLGATGTGTDLDPHVTTSSHFYLNAVRGLVPNTIAVHKFGFAEDIDTGDPPATVWDGCCDNLAGPKIVDYTFSTSADIGTISSSSAVDTQIIEVQGLDLNWNLVLQNVTLNGQNDVSLSTPLIRVFRMVNKGSIDVAGTIYLRTNGSGQSGGIPNTTSTVRAIIKDGDNQTQMALFAVPDGYSLYITHGWSALARQATTSSTIQIFRRTEGGVLRILHTLALNSQGSCTDQRPYQVPLKLESREDIIYKVKEVTTNGTGISAGFHGILIQD
jgi:hypothetical protein